MTYLLVIAYDGSDFAGWQTQDPDPRQNTRTVQGELERILGRIFRLPIKIEGSGRTDRGAHATGQTASFSMPVALTGDDLMRILGESMPSDIAIVSAHTVPDGFHARYDAVGKTYVYKIRNTAQSVPFIARYTHFVPLRRHRIDVGAMRRAASLFIGPHDFGSFMASGSDKKHTVRTIHAIEIEEYPLDAESTEREIHIRVTGDGFLYKMVRILVGTLLEFSAGVCSAEQIRHLLDRPDPGRKKTVAPACGLYLDNVYYE